MSLNSLKPDDALSLSLSLSLSRLTLSDETVYAPYSRESEFILDSGPPIAWLPRREGTSFLQVCTRSEEINYGRLVRVTHIYALAAGSLCYS